MRNAAAIVVRMPGNRVLTLTQCQQRCVTADRRRVDGDGLLGYKTLQIMGPAGFRTGPGEALATERLHADNRADVGDQRPAHTARAGARAARTGDPAVRRATVFLAGAVVVAMLGLVLAACGGAGTGLRYNGLR